MPETLPDTTPDTGRRVVIRALVADDELLSREALKHSIATHPNWQIVAEASNGNEVISALIDHAPDILFLDVEMPGMNGIEIADSIRRAARRPLVVFVTAYEQYALPAFKVNAAGYLMKPFDNTEFDQLIGRMERRLAMQTRSRAKSGSTTATNTRPGWLKVKRDHTQCMIPISKITKSVSARNYIHVYTEDTQYTLRASISEFMRLLGSNRFVRTHRSIIVNLDYADLLTQLPTGGWNLHLKNGARVPVSKAYLDELSRRLTRPNS